MPSNWYKDHHLWVFNTGTLDSTEAIGLSFVLLAYFLHPAVEAAFRRVRAYRGWKAIEKRQTVEITTYPLLREIFFGRGRWDAARMVAVLLAAFSLASWGLELQLGLAYIDGMVTDLYLRPPPVWRNDTASYNGSWHVESYESLQLADNEMGTNMFGSFSSGTANAMYKLDGSDAIIEGVVRVASWSISPNESAGTLFYNDNGTGIAKVTSHNCEDKPNNNPVHLYEENAPELWGVVLDCSHGPRKENGDISTAPVLKLINDKTGDMHFIVEESCTYPSFLYSVWKAENKSESSAVLNHIFHISSSARLAEALVTEIVHASKRSGGANEPTGGGAFALLRKFSERTSRYDVDPQNRASPFGELPTHESLADTPLSTLETLEAGVKLNMTALLCAVWLMALTLVGIAWSFFLRSRIGMDIYDRDELIRNVTLQASLDDAKHSSKMRIFVRKEDSGNVSVVVSDFQELRWGCARIFGGKHQTLATDDPIPFGVLNHANNFGGAAIAPGSRTVCLEGVRMGRGRTFPGRRGDYHYPTSVALSASPLPSHVGSIAETPVLQIASSTSFPLPNKLMPNLGPALFESSKDLDESNYYDSDVEMTRTSGSGNPKDEPCKTWGSLSPPPSESRQTEDFDRWELCIHSESTKTVNDRPVTPPAAESMIRPTVKRSERMGRTMVNPDETKNDLNSDTRTEQFSAWHDDE